MLQQKENVKIEGTKVIIGENVKETEKVSKEQLKNAGVAIEMEGKEEVKNTSTENTQEKKVDVKAQEVKEETSSKKEDVKNETSAKSSTGTKNKKEKVVAPEVEDIAKYQKTTRIEKSQNNRTIKNLYKNREKLRFDLAIQRNEVWTNDQKSMLIHSILYGYPVPPVMVLETDDDYIWFLDGKQRLTTILSFISDEFSLSKNTPDVYGFKIANHKFSDLTEDMQDIIHDENIALIKLKNMTDEERDEMFVRWNSGSTLSKIELTRAMHSDLIEQINSISELPFFAEDIAITDKGRNRFLDQEVILQIAMLLDEGKNNIKGFGSSQVKDYVLRLKEVGKTLPEKVIKQFKDVSHYLNLAVDDFEYADRKKALKKIHIPMVFYTAIKAMESKVRFYDYGAFIKEFLIKDYSVNSDYGQACQKGSSKKESVLTRLNEMDLALDEFIEALKSKKEVVKQ